MHALINYQNVEYTTILFRNYVWLFARTRQRKLPIGVRLGTLL